MQKNMTPGRRKGCPNYSPEFKQQLVAASANLDIHLKTGVWKWHTPTRLNGASSGAREAAITFLWEASVTSCDSRCHRRTTRTARWGLRAQHQLWGNVPARDTPPQRHCQRKLLTLLIQELKRWSRYQQAPKSGWLPVLPIWETASNGLAAKCRRRWKTNRCPAMSSSSAAAAVRLNFCGPPATAVPADQTAERGRFARRQLAMAKCSWPRRSWQCCWRHRLATAEAVADLPDHAVGFILGCRRIR